MKFTLFVLFFFTGIPLDGSSQPSDGTCVETGTTAECSVGEKLPNGDDLSTTKDASENPKLGDAATESQTSAITDIGIADCLTNVDGSTLQKLPTVDSQCDAISVFDSGIGTGTEGSLIEGSAITNRRKTLDLPPPPPSEEDIENENLAESDAQAASRVKEMTNLSEKVSQKVVNFWDLIMKKISFAGSQVASTFEANFITFRKKK